MAGQIISLILIGVIITLIILFFVQKKTALLAILYSASFLTLALFQLLDWYSTKNDFSSTVSVMQMICTILIFISVIVYQSDFKNIFMRLSKLYKKNTVVEITDDEIRSSIQAIVTACQTLAKSRTGALIVIVKNKIDQYILDSGVKLDAIVSAPLLESIFNTRCPMHDGAVIIKDNKILTAGSFLPLSKSDNISKDLGTRHRAGIGVTESEGNDIISIIISEENGIISTATNGVLRRYLTPERLYDLLYDPYKTVIGERKRRKSKKIFN